MNKAEGIEHIGEKYQNKSNYITNFAQSWVNNFAEAQDVLQYSFLSFLK